jgi:hypothetical protein
MSMFHQDPGSKAFESRNRKALSKPESYSKEDLDKTAMKLHENQ